MTEYVAIHVGADPTTIDPRRVMQEKAGWLVMSNHGLAPPTRCVVDPRRVTADQVRHEFGVVEVLSFPIANFSAAMAYEKTLADRAAAKRATER